MAFDRRDIRQYAVRLTPLGEERLYAGQAAAQAAEKKLLARLTRPDKKAFIATLCTLLETEGANQEQEKRTPRATAGRKK